MYEKQSPKILEQNLLINEKRLQRRQDSYRYQIVENRILRKLAVFYEKMNRSLQPVTEKRDSLVNYQR
jgi:hypothetical protein